MVLRVRWTGSIIAMNEAAEAYRNLKKKRKKNKKIRKNSPSQMLRDLRRSGGKDWYQKYLRSKHWKDRRFQKIKSVGGRCETCQSSHNLEVHHKAYDRLFQERNDDLIVLCVDCHRIEHEDKGGIDFLTAEFLSIVKGP